MQFKKHILLIFFLSFSLLLSNINLQEAGAENIKTEDNSKLDSSTSVSSRTSSSSDLFDFYLNITYAMIVPSILNSDELKSYRDWKTKKGVPAHIFILEDIYKYYPGKNSSDRIHKFLQDLKKEKPATSWLLLVGDSEWIPAPLIRADINGSEVISEIQDFAYSDYYYAAIDTDWDSDKDGIYGEVLEDFDWTPEFYVGRLPVSNAQELNIVLDKLYTYDKQPCEGPWYYNVILVGAAMDVRYGPNHPDDPETPIDDGYNDYKDNALEVNRKVKKLFPSNYNMIEFYDYHYIEPGKYSPLGDTLNRNNVVSSFDSGASVVNLVSHGYDNGDGHVEYAGDGENMLLRPFFDYEDAQNLKNGCQLPLVYSSSCTSGNFTEVDDTGLERLLTAPSGGAVGFIGATVTTYRGEFRENDTSFGNWWMDERFWSKILNGDRKAGKVLFQTKLGYLDRIAHQSNPHKNDIDYQQMFRVNFLAYNYLGDPELSIRLRPPQLLKVEFDEVYKPQNWRSSVTFRVKNMQTGSPVQNARIAISGNDQLSWADTDSNGEAKIELDTEPNQVYDITATADDYYPFESQFNVKAALNLELTSGNLSVDKDRLSSGAITNITLKFKNTGDISASEVELAFFDGYPSENNQISSIYTFVNVKSGDVRQISVPWTMLGGDHTIYAVIDPSDKLMEFNETDNTAFIMIYENNPPVFYTLPTIPLKEDRILNDALLLSNYVWDSDFDDNLSFKILSKSEPNCDVKINENNYIDIIPAENWFGSVNVSIEVTDGIETDTAYLKIDVIPVNDPPQLKYITNQSLLEDQWFEMVLFATDYADSDDRIFFETDLLDVIPALVDNVTVIFDRDTGELSILPDNSMVGDHIIKFRAVDENGASSDWQEIKFTIINTPDEPILSFDEEYDAEVGEKFVLNVKVFDDDTGDEIAFWDDTDLFDIDPNTGEISFTPESSDSGTHEITIYAFDGNNTVSKTFTLEIKGGGNEQIYILAAVGIVAIIGLIAGVFFIKNNRKKQEGPVDEKAESKDTEDDEESTGELEDDEEVEDKTESEEKEEETKRKKKPGITKGKRHSVKRKENE